MQRILLAVGEKKVEEYLKRPFADEDMKDEYIFVGEVIYKEAIIPKIRETHPDIVIISEALSGKTKIQKIVREIRQDFATRIIVMAGNHQLGDMFLRNLVSMGVYDIAASLSGSSINLKTIISFIKEPQSFSKAVEYCGLHFEDEDEEEEQNNVSVVVNESFLRAEEKVEDKEPIEVESKEDLDLGQGEHSNPIDTETPIIEETKILTSDMLNKEESLEQINVEQNVNLPIYEDISVKKSKKPKKTFFSKANNVLNIEQHKIICFSAVCEGVGCTFTAFNTAVNLARKGHKTLYVDLSENTSTVFSWMRIDNNVPGIDGYLNDLSSNNYSALSNNILRGYSIINSAVGKESTRLSKLPVQLDYLAFSVEYKRGKNQDLHNIKEVFNSLKNDLAYEYIILDTSLSLDELSISAISVADRNIAVMTQDLAIVNNTRLTILKVNELNIATNIIAFINKYEKCKPNDIDIQQILRIENVLKMNYEGKGVFESIARGIPYTVFSKTNTYQVLEKLL